ncbi:SDR family NAD(P)-dependent oxidoreductase [Streptococcus hyovaginalis]|uniref:SDR family NAD(P)-dependent oxidoreductase n=1 Tax=Streptococcus hyovaginalis TaxID=149015 RepID=UPI0014796F36|nr:SDR family NAD(P)-dependent oxidoreductase [Streptococcus hyovaginalis]
MVKSVLVTGVTSGFGAAIARDLVAKDYQVIGTGRRLERLDALKKELGDAFFSLQMDLVSKEKISLALSKLPERFRTVDILINNAGLALGLEKAHAVNFEDWETMIMTNVMGLTYLTRQILPGMVERQLGYVINIGSIAGTYPYPGGNVYGVTKAFVKQFSLNLRADLAGTHVRVTNIEPGLAGGTEFSNVRFKGDDDKANKVYEKANSLRPEDISRTVVWLLEQPEHMNVNRIEIMPTSQSFGALPVYKED